MKRECNNPRSIWLKLAILSACYSVSVLDGSEDRSVFFDVDDAGINKSIPTWGLDTAWLDSANVRRGVVFMGQPQVDVIRFSFTPDQPLVNGDLNAAAQDEFDQRMAIVDTYTEPDTELYFNPDGVRTDWYKDENNKTSADRWAQLIDVTRRKCVDAGRKVISVAPFNEPDYGTEQGDVNKLGEICRLLRSDPKYADNFAGVRLCSSVLNNDKAIAWYDPIKDVLDEGNSHQLAGSFDTYAAFHEYLEANGVVGTNDELHNVMEAMVGAEYGMDVGIWWGSAEYARGEFVKSSDGSRLGYAEHRTNWTAASVYRAPSGIVQAFVGASERQATTTTYQFVSKTRDVYFDGYGPQRTYTVELPGGNGYWVNQSNAEKVINVTWGEDIQPPVDGQYQIVNGATGMVMELEAAGDFDGTNIVQNLPGFIMHQYWDIIPLNSRNGGDYSYYSIRSAFTGKAADVYNWNLNAGAEIRQWEYYGNANQLWILEYVGDAYFRIRSRWSGKYLEVADGETPVGAKIHLAEASESRSQLWRLIPVDAAVEFDPPSAPTEISVGVYQVSIALSWKANEEPDLSGYNVYRSSALEGPFELIARGLTSTTFVDNNANQAIPYFYKVVAVDRSLNCSAFSDTVEAQPNGANALVAAYSFEENTLDGSGNENHAETYGGVAFDSNAIGMELNGTDSYVQLPATVLNHSELTISAWVKWFGGDDEQRIFDFGTGSDVCLYLTPKAADSGLQFSICSGDLVTTLNAPALIPNQWSFIEVVFDETTVSLFVGSVLVDSAPIEIRPSDLQPVLNYIGRGQNPEIPYFSGRIGDFRIYNFSTKSPNT